MWRRRSADVVAAAAATRRAACDVSNASRAKGRLLRWVKRGGGEEGDIPKAGGGVDQRCLLVKAVASY